MKQTVATFRKPDAVEALREFWARQGGEAAEYTLGRVTPKLIESEDVAALCLIALRMFGI